MVGTINLETEDNLKDENPFASLKDSFKMSLDMFHSTCYLNSTLEQMLALMQDAVMLYKSSGIFSLENIPLY